MKHIHTKCQVCGDWSFCHRNLEFVDEVLRARDWYFLGNSWRWRARHDCGSPLSTQPIKQWRKRHLRQVKFWEVRFRRFAINFLWPLRVFLDFRNTTGTDGRCSNAAGHLLWSTRLWGRRCFPWREFGDFVEPEKLQEQLGLGKTEWKSREFMWDFNERLKTSWSCYILLSVAAVWESPAHGQSKVILGLTLRFRNIPILV